MMGREVTVILDLQPTARKWV